MDAGVRILGDLMGALESPNKIDVRVLPEHGDIVFALVPLIEDAASELAAALENVIRWREERRPA